MITDVYVHRLKDPADFDTHAVFTECWKEEGNKINADIWMFSTEAELLKGDWHPAWRSCDYDDCKRHVGFPRDCGPRAAVLRNWNCIPGSTMSDCQKNTKFYVRTCGGVLPLAVSTNLGWTFIWFVGLGGMAYLTVGMTMQNRRTGAKGMSALPHRRFWLQLHGLVKDGVQFSATRAGVTLPAGYSRIPAVAPQALTHDSPVPQPPSSRKEGEGKSRRSKSKKEKAAAPERKEKKGKSKSSAAAVLAASSSSEVGAPAAVEERARQLAEQRDSTVHSSMAKVQVVTL